MGIDLATHQGPMDATTSYKPKFLPPCGPSSPQRETHNYRSDEEYELELEASPEPDPSVKADPPISLGWPRFYSSNEEHFAKKYSSRNLHFARKRGGSRL